MASSVVIMAASAGGCMHGCLATAGSAPGPPGSHGLAVTTLISWLVAEALGAYMLRSWVASGGARHRRTRPGSPSLPVITGHAGLALAGLVTWVSFLATATPALAWLAIGFLGPAIGLGVSTVTVWTPYPARHPDSGSEWSERSGESRPDEGAPGILVTDAMLDRALANEALTSKLVDDMLDRMLAEPPQARNRKWQLAPVIPILHGVAAITTFLLAVLAAIATVVTV